MWKYITGNIQNEFVMAGVALISMVLAVVDMLTPLEFGWHLVVYIVDAAICVFFAWQFYLDLKVAPEKRAYWKMRWFEVLALMPLGLLAVILALLPESRNMVVILIYQLLIVPFVVLRFLRVFSLSGRWVRQRGLIYLIVLSVGFILVGALVMLILEEGSGRAQITNFQDALWWSIAAITKVSYSDVVPVTPAGRVLGMVWMLLGVAVMAGIISEFSARLVESRLKRREGDELREKLIGEIKARVEKIDSMDETEMVALMQIIKSLRQKPDNAPSGRAGEPAGE